MSEYVSKEEVLKILCEKCPVYNCASGCNSYRSIEKMSSVQSQRPKGEWKLISMGLTYKYQCSLCGRTISTTPMFLADYPFCHCGAKMKGEEE